MPGGRRRPPRHDCASFAGMASRIGTVAKSQPACPAFRTRRTSVGKESNAKQGLPKLLEVERPLVFFPYKPKILVAAGFEPVTKGSYGIGFNDIGGGGHRP